MAKGNEKAPELVEEQEAKDKPEKTRKKKNPYEYNPEKKVTVKSIANWTTGFQRIEMVGDVTIPANGTVRLNASEIISQIQNGNMLFNGVDALGSHATLFITDKATRMEANFETEETEQNVATVEKVEECFKIAQQAAFEQAIYETFVTRAEKGFLMKTIKELSLNDYNKIAFCLSYTGMGLD